MKLHHVGIVVTDIVQASTAYERDLGYRREGALVDDPVQKVRIQFLQDQTGAGRVELLQPAGPDSPLEAARVKGGGLNHLCYEVGRLDEAVAAFRKQGAVLLSTPVPAPAMGGARIVFLFHRQFGVFELVEAPAHIPSPT